MQADGMIRGYFLSTGLFYSNGRLLLHSVEGSEKIVSRIWLKFGQRLGKLSLINMVILILNYFPTFIATFFNFVKRFFGFISEFANKICMWITSKVNESKYRHLAILCVILKNNSIPHGLVDWQSMAVEILAFFSWPSHLVHLDSNRWLCLE